MRRLLAFALAGVLATFLALPAAGALAAPTVTVTPSSGPPGTWVTVSGSGWTPGYHVYDLAHWWLTQQDPAWKCSATVGSDGTFTMPCVVPIDQPDGAVYTFSILGAIATAGEGPVDASYRVVVQPTATPAPSQPPPVAKKQPNHRAVAALWVARSLNKAFSATAASAQDASAYAYNKCLRYANNHRRGYENDCRGERWVRNGWIAVVFDRRKKPRRYGSGQGTTRQAAIASARRACKRRAGHRCRGKVFTATTGREGHIDGGRLSRGGAVLQ